MATLKIGTLFTTLAVTSATVSGDTKMFQADSTNGYNYTNISNNNIVPFDMDVMGFSKRIFRPAEVPAPEELDIINREIGVSVSRNNEAEFLVDHMPLEQIPEHHAPAGGVQETQASAANGWNSAVQDGGRIFKGDGILLSLIQGDLIEGNWHVWTTTPAITASKTWLLRFILWGYPLKA